MALITITAIPGIDTDKTPFRIVYFNSHRKAENDFAYVYCANLGHAAIIADALAEVDLQMLDLKESGFNIIDVERWDSDNQEWVDSSDAGFEEGQAY